MTACRRFTPIRLQFRSNSSREIEQVLVAEHVVAARLITSNSAPTNAACGGRGRQAGGPAPPSIGLG